MVAARACGVGVSRVAMAVWLSRRRWRYSWPGSISIWPAAAAESELRGEALRAGMLAPLKPGAFRSFSGGRVVVYARDYDPQGDLRDVFVKRTVGDIIETTVAQRARYSISADGESKTITLYDGERTEGVTRQQRYRIMHFGQQIHSGANARHQRAQHSHRCHEYGLPARRCSATVQAELQWRIGMPVMTIVLTMLAVPLSRLRPRPGR